MMGVDPLLQAIPIINPRNNSLCVQSVLTWLLSRLRVIQTFLGRHGFLDLAVVNFIVSNANCQRYGETPWKEVVNVYKVEDNDHAKAALPL